ncbi:Glycerol-3-phosphate acyltransferase [Planktothrix tepida]|uniref:Glycerol-3-phosphate acyltransferase n=2 Tax=Planktothrix TaxID=54304 RepID=A0A1J1LK43_9CYAN|nr:MULTISPECIES: glycerol-3-phosphate 1-O-acyltransferase PlsY [Planktothrix]CAD5945004.1 Glycerol-3-phosphate acyltransferase [Planktothrix tepida]CAD5966038.1 Glycerol-3-phosphate acyltransferase [Planktothrix pseudagardhii]CUR32855.1 Glycerol-3-phosphate acyltransferase [Planktothrix tepida PCC 9214]
MIEWLLINTGLLVTAYFLGSMPTGYAIGRWFYGVDILAEGSGSTGATNILRTLGKLPALLVLLIDILKGTLAVVLVFWVYSLSLTSELAQTAGIQNLDQLQYWIAILAGLIVIIGHTKSIWIGWRGGKSVASSLGILFALDWKLALATLGIFALVLAISRIVSLSSIAGAIGIGILMIVTGEPLPYQIFAIAGGVYVIWRHRSNIDRILKGTEPKVGEKLTSQVQS